MKLFLWSMTSACPPWPHPLFSPCLYPSFDYHLRCDATYRRSFPRLKLNEFSIIFIGSAGLWNFAKRFRLFKLLKAPGMCSWCVHLEWFCWKHNKRKCNSCNSVQADCRRTVVIGILSRFEIFKEATDDHHWDSLINRVEFISCENANQF